MKICVVCNCVSVSSTWSQPETQGRQPAARHGHIIAAVGSKIYIHGGMAGEKFYNDLYSLDSSKSFLIVKMSFWDAFKMIYLKYIHKSV